VSLLSAVLLVWTLLPIYNIIRVSMQEKEEVLSTSVYPIAPSPHAFSVVFHQAFWLLETSGTRWATVSLSVSLSRY
jgi:hypothetical protein